MRLEFVALGVADSKCNARRGLQQIAHCLRFGFVLPPVADLTLHGTVLAGFCFCRLHETKSRVVFLAIFKGVTYGACEEDNRRNGWRWDF